MEGYTLALDFPMNKNTLPFLEKLDEIVLAHGGRFYLAKDARLSAETMAKSDKRTAEFAAMRADMRLDKAFASLQSERLSL